MLQSVAQVLGTCDEMVLVMVGTSLGHGGCFCNCALLPCTHITSRSLGCSTDLYCDRSLATIIL